MPDVKHPAKWIRKSQKTGNAKNGKMRSKNSIKVGSDIASCILLLVLYRF